MTIGYKCTFPRERLVNNLPYLEGYAVHEGIYPCLSMTYAVSPKFVSHQEQLDVSRMQCIFFSVNNTILCLIKEVANTCRFSLLCNIIDLPRPLSNDPRFIQFIYHYSHASKRFVHL